MSQITCCPACGTMFRVVPDQLKISDGWVRCGHCAQVFDATAHMAGEAPAGAVSLEPDAPETQPMEFPPEPLQPSPEAAPILPVPPAQPLAAGVRDSELRESPLDQPFVFRRSDLGSDDIPSVSPPVSAPARLTQPSQLEDEDEPELRDMAFVRQARRRQQWRTPFARPILMLGLVVLSALLALQWAVHERDRLAASAPALRPWLEGICLALRCSVGPPRQIEALSIESSAFNRLRNDAYRLNFTLKNNAGTEVAVPSMELTLTDGQDQPLLRRVLTPADLGAAAPALPARGEWSASVALAVEGNGPSGRVAGYRLLAFYP